MAKKEIKEEVVETKEEKTETKVAPAESKEGNSKIIQIFIIVVVLVAVLAIVLVLTKDVRLSNDKKLEKNLTTMGEKYYTEFYYLEISKGKTTQEVSEFLSKFQDVGIKINLENLSRFNEGEFEDDLAKFKNGDKECDKTNTRAVVYPKSPYGKSDYNIKVELDCGFENAKK